MKMKFFQCLKDRKVVTGVLFVFVALLPVSLIYAAWLTDFHWWYPKGWIWDISGKVEDKKNDGGSDENFENLDYQLSNIRCPARVGLGLEDYWSCLWSTSITAKGLEQDRRIKWENYVKRIDAEREALERWHNFRAQGNNTTHETGADRRRVRRQTVSAADKFSYERMNSIFTDNYAGFFPIVNLQQQLKSCQQGIHPAVSISTFLLCLRKISLDPSLSFAGVFGKSFLPTYQPTTFPPELKTEYDTSEFPLIEMQDSNGQAFALRFEFKQLEDEERLSNFLGADPYFGDNWSPYRYKYNSLNTKQRQPGWSYEGLHNSKNWHKLDLERFYLPMKKSAKLEKVELVADFAQTYPGIGELAEGLENLLTPLDYRWTKDSGYNVYTRYLIPLLQKADMEYYKSKGLIDPSVTLKPDYVILQDIITGLEKFENETQDVISLYSVTGQISLNPKFPTMDDVPFVEAYVKSIQQFYNEDLLRYKNTKEKLGLANGDPIAWELEIMRQVLRAYVRAVKVQEACVREMVENHERRLEILDEEEYLVKKAMRANKTCVNVDTLEDAIKVDPSIRNDPEYRETPKGIHNLYGSYFDRKESRQRYSLPKYPVEFPVCKNNDPSPININVDKSRQSSIKDYVFGAAAYRLNRFFMFFPLDGSPLLTVGIVNGQRLDDSSVELTGGAVRGQNLTFQYMHIRFGDRYDGVGSEHWINGKGAAMELQMVFTVSGSADSIKYWHVLARVQNQLFQFREKLVIILSVLVDVLEEDKDVIDKIEKDKLLQDPYVFEALAQAAYHFRSVPEQYPTFEQPRGYVSVDPVFRFIDFIPSKSSNFYTYRGSLSWPPCFGYVIWSVFEQRLYMSKRQFDQFANIPAYGVQDSNLARNNFRHFEDIYVEEESDPNLNAFMLDELRKQRTVDRNILVGRHEISDEGHRKEEGVVGEDIYLLVESQASLNVLKEGFGMAVLKSVITMLLYL